MHTKEQLLEMHAEHNEWQNKIKFYRSELKKLNDNLGDFLSRKPSQSAMANIEHFQNQFTIQNEVMDIMRHDFKQHENAIEAKHNNLNATDSGLNENHETNQERLSQFEKLFHELRNEFHEFVEKEPQHSV